MHKGIYHGTIYYSERLETNRMSIKRGLAEYIMVLPHSGVLRSRKREWAKSLYSSTNKDWSLGT